LAGRFDAVKSVSGGVIDRLSAVGRQPVPPGVLARHLEMIREQHSATRPARAGFVSPAVWLAAAAVAVLAIGGVVVSVSNPEDGIRTVDAVPSATPADAPASAPVNDMVASADPTSPDRCAPPPGVPDEGSLPPASTSDPTDVGRRAEHEHDPGCKPAADQAPAGGAVVDGVADDITSRPDPVGDVPTTETHLDSAPSPGGDTSGSTPGTTPATGTLATEAIAIDEPSAPSTDEGSSDPCFGPPNFAGEDPEGPSRQQDSDAWEQIKAECEETDDETSSVGGTVHLPGDASTATVTAGPAPDVDPFPDDPCRGPPPKPAGCDDADQLPGLPEEP
jgi:hypothetical protein